MAKKVAANKSGRVCSTALNNAFEEPYNFPPYIQAKELKMSHDHRMDSKALVKMKKVELHKSIMMNAKKGALLTMGTFIRIMISYAQD